MKIGILTQPLLNNYGGLLQAYAMQSVLKSLGHDAWIIDREYKKSSLVRTILLNVKRFLITRKILNRPNSIFQPSLIEENIINENTTYFKQTYINPITLPINSDKVMRKLKSLNFDGYLVGSDQVWRPKYSPNILNYFLDFVEDSSVVKKISYAASFGVSEWEFNSKDTLLCKKLIHKFDAVSVREKSGVQLCKEHFDIEAVHNIDPTMLIEVDTYTKLIKAENEPNNLGTLMLYILDSSKEKDVLISKVEGKLDLISFTVMAKNKLKRDSYKNIQDCILPSVTKWLKGFEDAKFVITDSFHGCVFSILFNKPFIAIGNKERGVARFYSLLKLFGLENRLITDLNDITDELIFDQINWPLVNTILKEEREKSTSFLRVNLNK